MTDQPPLDLCKEIARIDRLLRQNQKLQSEQFQRNADELERATRRRFPDLAFWLAAILLIMLVSVAWSLPEWLHLFGIGR